MNQFQTPKSTNVAINILILMSKFLNKKGINKKYVKMIRYKIEIVLKLITMNTGYESIRILKIPINMISSV